MDPQGQFASGYVGMGNYPTVGVDPDGEFLLAAILIGAALNVGAQALAGNIDNVWDALGYAAIGGLSGAAGYGAGKLASAAINQVAGFGAGFGAGAAGGAAGGFAGGAGNAWAGGANLSDGLKVGGMGALAGGVTGGVFGGVSGGLNARAGGRSFFGGNFTNKSVGNYLRRNSLGMDGPMLAFNGGGGDKIYGTSLATEKWYTGRGVYNVLPGITVYGEGAVSQAVRAGMANAAGVIFNVGLAIAPLPGAGLVARGLGYAGRAASRSYAGLGSRFLKFKVPANFQLNSVKESVMNRSFQKLGKRNYVKFLQKTGNVKGTHQILQKVYNTNYDFFGQQALKNMVDNPLFGVKGLPPIW